MTISKKKLQVAGQELDWAELQLPQNKHLLLNLSQESLSRIMDVHEITSGILELLANQQPTAK